MAKLRYCRSLDSRLRGNDKNNKEIYAKKGGIFGRG